MTSINSSKENTFCTQYLMDMNDNAAYLQRDRTATSG